MAKERKVPVQTNLTAAEAQALAAIADREGTSVAAVVRRMVLRDAEFLREMAAAAAEAQGGE